MCVCKCVCLYCVDCRVASNVRICIKVACLHIHILTAYLHNISQQWKIHRPHWSPTIRLRLRCVLKRKKLHRRTLSLRYTNSRFLTNAICDVYESPVYDLFSLCRLATYTCRSCMFPLVMSSGVYIFTSSLNERCENHVSVCI